MLKNRIYYGIKPFLPKFLRMAVRRNLARRKRGRVSDVWPILPGSERPPPHWSGWPEGKQFAFVLTHDVEGPLGLRHARSLFDFEREMKFRSSFNFIPEGSYHVPAELRSELTANGFEVGVHDLEHDGRLYQSREQFMRKAVRINRYLRDWNASGFRSGFMLHNLRWLHDLEIRYDASTFDTDPFEPQPDGSHTIFPFWVPSPGGMAEPGPAEKPGYVEMPYTLPQDSTLFLLLGEQTADVWIKKLDWIASRGGMALVNIHPDYIDFSANAKASRSKYPLARLRELLEHITSRYGDRCWNPCARELATWYTAANPPPASGSPENVLSTASFSRADFQQRRAAVLLYSHHPSDPRPRRAVEALAEAGMEVDIICLREGDEEPTREKTGGVSVLRLPLRKRRGSKTAYLTLYSQFILYSFALLAWRGWRRKYDLVHVHNMPDVLVFAALSPKLRGARVLLDLHDPMPELMMSIYGLESDHRFVRLLRRLEHWSIGFADLAITPNITFRNLFVSRSCPPGKMQIVMNSPQQQIFDPDRTDLPVGPDLREGHPAAEFRLMHHGSIVHRHGVDRLVEALAKVRGKLPGVRLDIYGSPTPFLEIVLETGRRLGVADCIHFHGPKSQAEIAEAIRACHLGVVPNRRSAFTDINLPTRLFEYLAMRRPVVAPSTQGIRDYFGPGEMLMFDRDDIDDLAEKILWVAAHPGETGEIVERGIEIYRKHLWEEEKTRFLGYVASLLRTEDSPSADWPAALAAAGRLPGEVPQIVERTQT